MTEHANHSRVLLVEDSEPLRHVLAEKLRDAGLEVDEAGGGEEGLKHAADHQPDLIITDLVMFPMDGIEMASKIRETGLWGKSIKIVALTNQSAEEEKARLDRANFDAYFVKAETSLDDVVAKAKEILGAKKK